jgi:hypothetical protein
MNFFDDLGLGQVELVEGTLEADAPGVELGAHRAVAQERTSAKPFQKRMGAGFGASRSGSHGAQ